MNAKGKRKLINSLTAAIDEWLETENPNESVGCYIGYISGATTKLMATVAITLLEANSDAQRYAVQEGLLNQ